MLKLCVQFSKPELIITGFYKYCVCFHTHTDEKTLKKREEDTGAYMQMGSIPAEIHYNQKCVDTSDRIQCIQKVYTLLLKWQILCSVT